MLKQNSATSDTAAPLAKDAEFTREEDHKIIVEFEHLKAEITDSLNEEEIKLTANLDTPVETSQEPNDSTEFEKKWRYLRGMFVNKIFTNTKEGSSLYIKGSVMKGYYKWVHSERGLSNEVINNMSLSSKVLWFLKELGELGPDSTITDMSDGLTDVNRRRLELLKQHLLSKMYDMAFLENLASKFKNLKSTNPEMEKLFKQLLSGKVDVENYALFGKLLRVIFEGEYEDISQHFVLLENLYKAVQDNNRSEMLIDQLRKELGNSLEIMNFPESKEDDIVIGEPGIVESRESLKDESVIEHRKTEQKESRNLDDFEDFILIEIEKAVESPAKIKTNPSPPNYSDADEPKETSDVQENSTDLHTQNARKQVEAKRDEEILVKEVKLFKSTDPKNAVENREEREKLLEEIKREISDSKSNENNEKKSNEKVRSEQKNVAYEKIRADDPLEDFKKPVWASEEGKATEEFSEFQESSEVKSTEQAAPRKRKYGHQEEEEEEGKDAVSRKKSNVNTRDGDKHINDEL